MVDPSLMWEIVVSLAIGTLIGMEREHHFVGKKEFAGWRTFTLVSLFGTICAILADVYGIWMAIVGLAAVGTFASVGYFLTYKARKSIGLTTEVVFIMAFALGLMVHTMDIGTPIALSVIATLILAIKEYTKQVAKTLKKIEIMDTLKFAIIAFIILPLLPNSYIDPFNIINPYHLWLLVIFISGISFFIYSCSTNFILSIFSSIV